jgi:hypothetical protein
MAKFKVEHVHQITNVKSNLNIFEQTLSISEPITKFVTREMLIFKHYQVVFKKIKCLFQLWAKHEAMFFIVSFLAQQILEIAGLQIEIKKIFSLTRVFTKLRRCCLQSIFLKKLIFVNKN